MVVVLYFIAGVLFMKFAKGAQGTELVPNVKFWSTLPFYVKVSGLIMAYYALMGCHTCRCHNIVEVNIRICGMHG